MSDTLPGRLVDIPLPPGLAEALGYCFPGRFVCFRWSYGELTFDDGITAGDAASHLFVRYCRHPAVAGLLDDLSLGSDTSSRLALLIDRHHNRASIAPSQETLDFVRDQ